MRELSGKELLMEKGDCDAERVRMSAYSLQFSHLDGRNITKIYKAQHILLHSEVGDTLDEAGWLIQDRRRGRNE
jgi:hypothetical protein